MAAILVLFFYLLSCPFRVFILHILMHLFFTYTHKRNNVTVAYFLKFMSIFLEFILFTSHLNIMCFDNWANKNKFCVFF